MNSIVTVAVVILTITLVVAVASFGYKSYNNSISNVRDYPPFGSIYIKSVDFSSGEITIVNNYGKRVRFPIVVHYNIGNNTWIYKTVYVESYPGEYTVNLERLLGVNGNITIDYQGSFMMIGASRYPLLPGSGYAKSIMVGEKNTTSLRLKFPFLGQSVDKNTSVYESGVYDSDKAYFAPSLKVQVKYYRDVGGVHPYTYVEERDYGERCIYNSTSEVGEAYNTSTHDCELVHCSLEQDSVNQNYNKTINATRLCGTSGTYEYGETAESKPYTDYALTVYLPEASGKPSPLSRASGYLGPTDTATGDYPYKANKTACNYLYKEYEWTANLTNKNQYICDDICGSVMQGTFCNDTRHLVKEEVRYGCDEVCIKFGKMINVTISSLSMNTTNAAVLVDDSEIVIEGYIYSQGKIWLNSSDPDIIPRNMTVDFTLNTKLTMPRGHGYITLPHGGYIASILLKYNATFTAYGWLNTTDQKIRLHIYIPVNKTVQPVATYKGQNTYEIVIPQTPIVFSYEKTISEKPRTTNYVLLLHYEVRIQALLLVTGGIR